MTYACVMIMLALAAIPAWGQDAVGLVKTVSGDATLVEQGKTMVAQVGMPVKLGTVLKTGPGGTMGVTFKDNTMMSFGPDTEVTVDEYIYAPGRDDLKFSARITRGTLSLISGVIARLKPDAASVTTPTGTIGIRGTHVAVKVVPQAAGERK